MEYHEIKLYNIIVINYNHDLKQYFMENFLEDREILLKTELIKPDDL